MCALVGVLIPQSKVNVPHLTTNALDFIMSKNINLVLKRTTSPKVFK